MAKAVFTCLFLLTELYANCASAADFQLLNARLQEYADAVVSLMSYSAIPDLAASDLAISNSKSGNPSITMWQVGGGATVGDDPPIYLEGAAAYSRYDPTFLVTNGTEVRELPLKWNSGALQGGVGYDFSMADNWVIRPIFNISIGQVFSDVRATQVYLQNKGGEEIEFSQGGSMTVGGFGASLMLDYELMTLPHDIDFEVRYSYIYLETLGGRDAVQGVANSSAASAYFRWRAPIDNWTLLQEPFRYVLETSLSYYLGDQAGILGFDHLASLGAGVELDSSNYKVIVTRTRLVARYMFGNGAYGYGAGLAVSF